MHKDSQFRHDLKIYGISLMLSHTKAWLPTSIPFIHTYLRWLATNQTLLCPTEISQLQSHTHIAGYYREISSPLRCW